MKKVIYPIAMLIIFTATIVFYFIFQTEQVRPNGWVHEKGSRYYYENGKMKIDCWVKSPTGDRYYFDTDGKMKTGWVKTGEDRYYLGKNGKMKTGWIKVGTPWYYLGEDGKMKTGILKHSDKYYNLNKEGRLFIGWQYINSDFGQYLTEDQKSTFSINDITALKFDKYGNVISYLEKRNEKKIYGNKTMGLDSFVNDLKSYHTFGHPVISLQITEMN
ncbi:N-acetylmuramoyl-L-alanine amidase family protein [Bacillus paramycoides]|uniref:N-acetylmuramoyl-L-alanine amidase family protein n=1 Tax=Bacillus paramycoides TaxID=2026194 RepID=UPI003CFED94A